MDRCELMINNNSRFGSISDDGYDENLFRQVTASLYANAIPSMATIKNTGAETSAMKADHSPRFIYFHPFALSPFESQPSGSLNASRCNNIVLKVKPLDTVATMVLDVYAVNHNILRFMNGTAGLLYNS